MIEQMTNSEKQVMDLLWKSREPLSCTEIVKQSGDKTWKDSYVHSIIKSLTKKGIVKIVSFELVSRSYARKFAPAISYDEYVLRSNYTPEELLEPKRMGNLIQTILNHMDYEKMKVKMDKINRLKLPPK